jgi:hypothetical protein
MGSGYILPAQPEAVALLESNLNAGVGEQTPREPETGSRITTGAEAIVGHKHATSSFFPFSGSALGGIMRGMDF